MLNRETQTGQNRRIPVPVSLETAKEMIKLVQVKIESAIEDNDIAALFSNILGIPLATNRVSIKLGDENSVDSFILYLLIGQYIGPRLPEGATTLPPNATINWWMI